jgi:preprotein translocase subunit SecD
MAQLVLARMMREQAARPIISDSPQQGVETGAKSTVEKATLEAQVATKTKVTKAVKPKPVVSPVKPIASPSKEYTYQGRQVSLRPEMIFDITGKVENAAVFQDGGFLGISVTLKNNARQALKEFSERNIDQEAGLISKGRLVSVAFIRGAIPDGRLQISGAGSIDEMMKLAAELSAK